MRGARSIAVATLALVAPAAMGQETRIASDFEIQEMERVARSGDLVSQLSSHLNLGMLRQARGETDLARREFDTVCRLTESTRQSARARGELPLYAAATLYEALAEAALDRPHRAFELAEEGVRYSPTEKSWTVVANTMEAIEQPAKAVGAARNAVALGERQVAVVPSAANQLDLVVAQYGLATSLARAGEPEAAMAILETSVARLQSSAFDGVRKEVASHESFEIFSTVRGEVQAYVSALVRTELKLASLYEGAGCLADARRLYHDVLAARTDEAAALAALARLARDEAERARRLAAALDADPFSIPTIREFQKVLASRDRSSIVPEGGAGPGAQVRRALEQLQLGQPGAARATLAELATAFPDNDVVQALLALTDVRLGDLHAARARTIRAPELSAQVAEWIGARTVSAPQWLDGSAAKANAGEGDLRSMMLLLADNGLTSEQRVVLDRVVLSSGAVFDPSPAVAPPGRTVFSTGRIGAVPIAFAQPTTFVGTFAAGSSLLLEYRLLGVTEVAGAQGLLVEPVRLERR